MRRWERVGELVVVALILVTVYTVVTARPSASSSGKVYPPGWPNPPGSPITVQFGSPTGGPVSCGAGGTAYAERVPWVNSSQPLNTGETYVVFKELGDGDDIGDPNVAADATPSTLCAGAPPDSSSVWYVVLAAPNGTNLLTYTEAGFWSPVTAGPTNIPIQSGSELVLISYTSFAGTGRGLAVLGYVGQSSISGSVPL